ncbi:3-hydroxyacyl-CoA dehydrogenase NAD-binding domain-containing protein [Acidovorax sp. LjRoot129]|uniref:3-hydroxyacyl-CoA dehydrogenase family protein n=1 Tax=Acidovorax sp. LjRoot129 TaxID=3342260 RepID=UPI003ECC5495
MDISSPRNARTVVVGGGTMGADVAVVLARGGARVTVVDPHVTRREHLLPHIAAELEATGLAASAGPVEVCASLQEVAWDGVVLVVECITEQLAAKQQLFAELEATAPASAVLASNSSGFPISAIAQGLPTAQRMLGLHFFMPAHLVPLVEVVLGERSDPTLGEWLHGFMRRCGSVPVLVKKDKPGFLANRMQHALSREAFALIDEGIASPEDVDAAVRFGFGFRFLAAGPVLQRDHAGIEVHCAAAATMYPTLCNTDVPAQALRDRVAQGHLGMKTGKGFFDWPEDRKRAERARYDALLRQGLALLASELPAVEPPAQQDTPGVAP